MVFHRLLFLVTIVLTLFTSVYAAPITDFQAIWYKVQKYNPSLMAECWNVNASAGKAEQARLLPNPIMGLIVENIGAKNQKEEETQSTLMITQAVPLGNKYINRVRFKNSEYQVQLRAYSLAYATKYAEAGQKYVNILIAQHIYQTLEESFRISGLTVETINKRNHAGKSSLLELNSAKIAAKEIEIQLQLAQSQLNIARAELAALWGGSPNEVGTVQDIGLSHNLLPLAILMKYICRSPLIQQAFVQTEAEYNGLLASQSDAWPDLNISVGYRHFKQTHDNAAVVGLSAPIPLFDRNQGNIHAAFAAYSEKLVMQQATSIMLKKQIYILYQKASQAQAEMKIINTQILPSASAAFETAKNGYGQGKFSYLELLNSQQKLLDQRARYWEVHGIYDKTLVELYSLLGLIPY